MWKIRCVVVDGEDEGGKEEGKRAREVGKMEDLNIRERKERWQATIEPVLEDKPFCQVTFSLPSAEGCPLQ